MEAIREAIQSGKKEAIMAGGIFVDAGRQLEDSDELYAHVDHIKVLIICCTGK